MFEQPLVMEDLVAEPLNGRGDDGGLARVPDANGGHVRHAEQLGGHHFKTTMNNQSQNHITKEKHNGRLEYLTIAA